RDMTPLPVGKLNASVEDAFARMVDDNDVHQIALAIYTERKFKPLILANGEWTDDAEQIVQALGAAEQHAMEKRYPDPVTLEEARQRLPEIASGLGELRHFEATDAEWDAVIERLEDEEFDPKSPDAVETLLTRLQSQGVDNPMPRLADRIRTVEFLSGEWAVLVGEAEARLALGAATWASEMQLGWHGNTTRHNPVKRIARKDTRYRARVRAWFAYLDDAGAEKALASLLPKHPQYSMLVDA